LRLRQPAIPRHGERAGRLSRRTGVLPTLGKPRYIIGRLAGWLHGPWPVELMPATRNQQRLPGWAPSSSQEERVALSVCFQFSSSIGSGHIWMK